MLFLQKPPNKIAGYLKPCAEHIKHKLIQQKTAPRIARGGWCGLAAGRVEG
jgi:hypothetical protein